MSELVTVLAPLGVGGVLAAFIFWSSRRDQIEHASTLKEHAAAWRGQTDLLMGVLRENTRAFTSLQETTTALQDTIQGLQLELARREPFSCPYGHTAAPGPVPRHSRN